MNLPYSVRLLCLSLASFFLVNLVAGLLVSALAKFAGRVARRMRSRDGARFLFALRLAPVALGVFVVGCLCVPSYLWMEPEAINEPVGGLCLLAAGLAVLVWLLSTLRAARAVMRSRRYLLQCREGERVIGIPGERFAACVIRRREPLFATAGILRPRLMISECAIAAFPGEELASALRHERAHGESHDNLKHLLMLLVPDSLPFVPAMRPLERAWAALAEWSADDRASAGSERRSVALASALIRAARLTASPHPPLDLVTPLLADAGDLSERVDRLLGNKAVPEFPGKSFGAAGVLVLTLFSISAMLHPATLSFAHGILERLIH